MIILYTFQNSFRLCSQKYNTAIFFHLGNIALPHRNTTATGYYNIRSGLHLDQKICLELTEILFTVSLKDIGNAHSLSLHDTLIHLHNIHGKNILQIIGDRRFTSSHKSDQEDIIIEKISGLDPFTVLCDACKNIIDLFPFWLPAILSASPPVPAEVPEDR